MFGSTILDVAIGLVLVYALLSAICSAINELVAGVVGLRARNLRHGVRTLLDDVGGKGLAQQVLDHGLIRSLGPQPSYIPAPMFATALIGTLTAHGAAPRNVAELRTAISRLPSARMQQALLGLLHGVEGDVRRAEHRLAQWFDSGMERVSGWYRRRVQVILLVIGGVVTVGLQVDTLEVGNALLRDSGLRSAVVASAQATVARPPAETGAMPAASIRALTDQLDSLRLPIGWRHRRVGAGSGGAEEFDHVAGLLLTTLALSLGAPFWFDLLKRFVNLRSSGPPPERTLATPEAPAPAS